MADKDETAAMAELSRDLGGVDLSDEALAQGLPETSPSADAPNEHPEGAAQQTQQQPGDNAGQQQPSQQAKAPQSYADQQVVPAKVLADERREWKRQMDEMRGRIEQLTLQQTRPQGDAPKQAVPDLPDPFLDPKGHAEAVARGLVEARLKEQLSPLQQQYAQTMDYLFRNSAEGKYGADEVGKAEAEIMRMRDSGQLTPADIARLQSSQQRPNVYTNAVEFLRERALLAEVGGDVNAYRQRLLEEALKDPEYLGRATEAARALAAGGSQPQLAAQSRAAPVPARAAQASTQRAPAIPSVNRAGSASGAGAVIKSDPTDEELMKEALAGRR